jgi:hypothetical protein
MYWEGIYGALGIGDVALIVESFIDQQPLRAYFNSHGFSVKPQRGIFRRWYEHFESLAADSSFQETACKEQKHRIFLFQAILSALIASTLTESKICILPPTYNYPYNLHDRIPDSRRARVMNDLVTMTYEGRNIHPQSVNDIGIHEPLRAWLKTNAPS